MKIHSSWNEGIGVSGRSLLREAIRRLDANCYAHWHFHWLPHTIVKNSDQKINWVHFKWVSSIIRISFNSLKKTLLIQLSKFFKRVVDQEELDDMSEPRKLDHSTVNLNKSALKSSNRNQSLPSRWTRDRVRNSDSHEWRTATSASCFTSSSCVIDGPFYGMMSQLLIQHMSESTWFDVALPRSFRTIKDLDVDALTKFL